MQVNLMADAQIEIHDWEDALITIHEVRHELLIDHMNTTEGKTMQLFY